MAIFSCNTGYQLSVTGAGNSSACRQGRWIGAIQSCVDIDECDGIDCGGLSICKNGVGKYTCECAKGWSGGGVNQICEKGHCKCTGNQGFWKAETKIVDGKVKMAYDWGSNYGASCVAHDIKDYDPNDPEDTWKLEPWYTSRLPVRQMMHN